LVGGFEDVGFAQIDLAGLVWGLYYL